MKKVLVVTFMLMCLFLVGCEDSVAKKEYDEIVAERDSYKEKYESILERYSELKLENTKKDIAEQIEAEKTETSESTETQDNDVSKVVLYEDSNAKIYFSAITDKGVEFLVENKTDLNITIQADTVSVNGMSTDSIIMSDDVAPRSKGKVVAKCDDFSTNTVVETVGGQLRIIDFSETLEPHSYGAKFVNVPIE